VLWVVAFHWFNPLFWLAVRRIRAEAEIAADDFVILAGVRPSHYAAELLHFAGQLRSEDEKPLGLAIPFLTPFTIETRIRSIVSSTTHRRFDFGRVVTLGLIIMGCCISASFLYPSVSLGQEAEEHSKAIQLQEIAKAKSVATQVKTNGSPEAGRFPTLLARSPDEVNSGDEDWQGIAIKGADGLKRQAGRDEAVPTKSPDRIRRLISGHPNPLSADSVENSGLSSSRKVAPVARNLDDVNRGDAEREGITIKSADGSNRQFEWGEPTPSRSPDRIWPGPSGHMTPLGADNVKNGDLSRSRTPASAPADGAVPPQSGISP
jgi:hypothetical protein